MTYESFKELPAELWCEIARVLPLEDRRRLSTVNSHLRQLLIPILYSTIRITSIPSDQPAIADLVAKYGRHVRGLALTMDLGGRDNPRVWNRDTYSYEEDEEGDDEYLGMFADWTSLGLPDATRQLLAGRTLPEVTSVVILFASSHDGEDREGHGFRYRWEELWSSGYGTPRPPEELEDDEPWRANLANMWQALAENPGLRRLAVKNLIPVDVSTWDNPVWAAFLGRLETLELGLWGNYEHSFLREDYHLFQGNLNLPFYRHLSEKLRRFALTAGSVLGSDDEELAPRFELSGPERCYMPHLRELYIKDCIVNSDLAVFIAERGRVNLRVVELVNCTARTVRVERHVFEVPFSWADFFETILKTGERSEIVLERFALVRDWPFELDADGEEAPVREAQRLREQDGRRGGGGGGSGAFFDGAEQVLFPYVTVFEEGEWSQEGRSNLQRAVAGDDAKACREVMDIVRANRERRSAKH
ncbi:hypothetical protein PG996_010826 [Apiospora saccharicola]|uniref:F-box domain-containing protein n=1 Tax=Apiospora saccharicola TaxID=335842 RepID=A0ABR1UPR3_9PEZI